MFKLIVNLIIAKLVPFEDAATAIKITVYLILGFVV